MNALANPEVGKYLNEHFVSSFQKVATFRIVNGQKQGGNVAAYFCAQDGRVLHCIAGPVDAGTMLREAKWVVETTKKALGDSKKTGKQFKAIYRELHADRLKKEHGMVVEAVTFDPDADGGISYRDPSGQPLAPVLRLVPIEGPDVTLGAEKVRALQERNAKAAALPGGAGAPVNLIADRGGRRWALTAQGQVHMLLAGHSMQPIEKLYGTIFEGILGEKITTKPVEIVSPFPWRNHVKGG